MLFAEQAYRLCRTGGACSFIVPIQTLHQPNALALRTLLVENCWIVEIVDLGEVEVFDEALVKTCILVYSPDPTGNTRIVTLRSPLDPNIGDTAPVKVPQSVLARASEHSFKPDLLAVTGLIERIAEETTPLGDLFYVTFGLRSCAPGTAQGGKDRLVLTGPTTLNAKPYMEGREIARYETNWSGRYIDYIPEEMYSARSPDLFEQTKLVAQSMLSKKRLVVTFDDERRFVEQSLVCIVSQGAPPVDNEGPSFHYVLALMNSTLVSYYFAKLIIGYSLGGGLIHATPGSLAKLPIRKIAFTTPTPDRARYADESQRLYAQFGATGDPASILAFVEHHLAQEQSDVVHDLLALLAEQMIAMNKDKQAEVKGFLAWLAREIGAPLDGLSNKTRLQAYLGDYQKSVPHATLDELLAVLRQNRRKLAVDPSARAFQERLAAEYEASLAVLLPFKLRLAAADRLIDRVVYRLYGLIEDEITIVEGLHA